MNTTEHILATVLAVGIGSAALASTQIPAPAQDRPIALIGGTVHTVDGDDINGGTVIFDNGRITAVGTNVSVPANAERIDVAGKHVYPGLIDADTYIGLTEIGSVRATEDRSETGSINPNARAEVAVNPESELIPVARSNGVTSVLTLPSGGVISGMGAVLNLDGWTWEDMTLRAPVAMRVNWPRMTTITAWWMRESEEDQLKQRDKNLKEIQQAFDDARAYMIARRANGSAHEHDARWEAMIPVLEGKLPVVVDADQLEQIQAAVAFAERENIKLIVLGGYDAPHCTELLKRRDIPVIIQGINRLPQRNDDPFDDPFTVPDRLRKAGVRYCITEGGASNVRNLPYQAAKAASYGLPKDEALKAITLYPAQIIGVADRIGSLTVGKDANIIVSDGDIMETPTNVEMEFISGRKTDLSDKQKILWEKYKEKYRRQGITN